MEEQKEIVKQFRQQQEKYAYYIIALCAAAIGFSVTKTSGQPLRWVQIPLGLAVFSWALSMYSGLKFLSYVISSLYTNNEYFEILKGNDPKVGNHPERINAAASGIMQAMEINSNRANSYAVWQNRLFYFGMMTFIIWHVLEMYVKTKAA